MKIIQLDSIDSTNQYIKENFQSLNHLDVITTRNQTSGKGRRVNTWFSNQDSLTFSVLLKDSINHQNISLLPLLMAKVLHKIISHHSNDVYIKWPNDIYIQDKKISGILIESIHQTKTCAIIIGVGINLNNIEFPNDIRENVLSLKQITNNTFSHDALLKEIFNELKSSLHQLNDNTKIIIDYCNQYHLLNNEEITYEENQEIKNAKCLKINNDGNLLIKDDNKTISLISGIVNKIRIH
jgi:BirA family biotin operon repressor/biotin-[acetyl-CoA-carboxylase] ligase